MDLALRQKAVFDDRLPSVFQPHLGKLSEEVLELYPHGLLYQFDGSTNLTVAPVKVVSEPYDFKGYTH